MKFYVSGPMTGIENYNRDAFAEASEGLRRLGHDVVSPAEMDLRSPLMRGQWGDFLGRDLEVIRTGGIEGIVVLDGWTASDGAQVEVHLGRMRGMPIYAWPDMSELLWPETQEQTIPEGPIKRALPLVHGDRQRDYGHPAEDFARTAAIWRAMFGWDVKPEDVPLAMIGVKLSRLRKSPRHQDSSTDIAGYIETYDMTINHA